MQVCDPMRIWRHMVCLFSHVFVNLKGLHVWDPVYNWRYSGFSSHNAFAIFMCIATQRNSGGIVTKSLWTLSVTVNTAFHACVRPSAYLETHSVYIFSQCSLRSICVYSLHCISCMYGDPAQYWRHSDQKLANFKCYCQHCISCMCVAQFISGDT